MRKLTTINSVKNLTETAIILDEYQRFKETGFSASLNDFHEQDRTLIRDIYSFVTDLRKYYKLLLSCNGLIFELFTFFYEFFCSVHAF